MSQAISVPESEPDGHFVMIPLSQGKFALVDEADAGWILAMGKWSAVRAPRTYYASRQEGRPLRPVYMHALMAGFKGPDHANRNGLDNRRVNLRQATTSQNHANKEPQRNNKSGYKGVSWNRRCRKWKAQVSVSGQRIYLGLFDDPLDAARAYNEAALAAFGEFAWLNPLPMDAAKPSAA